MVQAQLNLDQVYSGVRQARDLGLTGALSQNVLEASVVAGGRKDALVKDPYVMQMMLLYQLAEEVRRRERLGPQQ